MPGSEPFAELDLPALERDALEVLHRGGYVSAGDRIPWRGGRRHWLDSVRLVDDDTAGLVALIILEAVELAAQQDGEGAFRALAAISSEVALAASARLYVSMKRAGQKGAAAQKRDPRGRPPRLGIGTTNIAKDAAELDRYAKAICAEVQRDPRHLSVKSQALKHWARDLSSRVPFTRFYDQMRQRCRAVLRPRPVKSK